MNCDAKRMPKTKKPVPTRCKEVTCTMEVDPSGTHAVIACNGRDITGLRAQIRACFNSQTVSSEPEESMSQFVKKYAQTNYVDVTVEQARHFVPLLVQFVYFQERGTHESRKGKLEKSWELVTACGRHSILTAQWIEKAHNFESAIDVAMHKRSSVELLVKLPDINDALQSLMEWVSKTTSHSVSSPQDVSDPNEHSVSSVQTDDAHDAVAMTTDASLSNPHDSSNPNEHSAYSVQTDDPESDVGIGNVLLMEAVSEPTVNYNMALLALVTEVLQNDPIYRAIAKEDDQTGSHHTSPLNPKVQLSLGGDSDDSQNYTSFLESHHQHRPEPSNSLSPSESTATYHTYDGAAWSTRESNTAVERLLPSDGKVSAEHLAAVPRTMYHPDYGEEVEEQKQESTSGSNGHPHVGET